MARSAGCGPITSMFLCKLSALRQRFTYSSCTLRKRPLKFDDTSPTSGIAAPERDARRPHISYPNVQRTPKNARNFLYHCPLYVFECRFLRFAAGCSSKWAEQLVGAVLPPRTWCYEGTLMTIESGPCSCQHWVLRLWRAPHFPARSLPGA